MRLFSRMYEMAMKWSCHRHAPRYLAALSFMESSFFPLPVDVMLAPMALAQPQKAWRFAMIAALFSVVGGIVGFTLGYFAMDLLIPWIHTFNYWDRYQEIIQWFKEWGIWVVFIAGFSPVPYKLFTITAGALHMALIPFILISIVARGLRYYAVSALMVWGGAPMEKKLHKYMDIIGWVVIVVILVIYFIVKH